MFIRNAREDLVVDVGVLLGSRHPQVFVCCIIDWIFDLFHLNNKISFNILEVAMKLTMVKRSFPLKIYSKITSPA